MVEFFEIEEDSDRNDFKKIIEENQDIIIIKFGADWCGPCQKIKPCVKECLEDLDLYMKTTKKEKVVKYTEMIVDDYFDIYSFFKAKKMVNGIPHMICYFGDKNDDRTHYYIADLSVSGGNTKEIKQFFEIIKQKM